MGEEKAPPWPSGLPAPETVVVKEEGRFRAEIINYVKKANGVKDIVVRGPARQTKKEALKDGAELRRAALKGGHDPSLFHVRARRKELEIVKWKDTDLVGPDVEDEGEEERQRRRREQEERHRKEEEAKKKKEATYEETLARIARQHDEAMSKFKPAGPNWKKPGSMVVLPKFKGHPDHPNAWMIHEKQDSTGKYKPWLYFSAATGKYFRPSGDEGFVQTGVPHDPRDFNVAVHVGSYSIPTAIGKKLDMAVLLPELHKTGFLLKQPLEFLDKPASLLVLCDGLRGSSAATEFCAKKFHSQLLPKLSARATEWEDFELADIVRDAAETLDSVLLDSPAACAGCNLGVALLAGTRLVIGALGGVRCLVYRPPLQASATKATTPRETTAQKPWVVSQLLGGDDHTMAGSEDERLRVESASGRLLLTMDAGDTSGKGSGCSELRPGSMKEPALAAIPQERERLLAQVAGAANPFAALGLKAVDLQAGASAIRRTFRKMSLIVHPDKVGEALRQCAVAAFAKLEAASSAIEAMLQADAAAAALVAELDLAHDEGKLMCDPAAAASLLGVAEGSEQKVVKAAVKKKFHGPLSRIQNVARKDVERAFKIIEVAEETVLRGSKLWQPLAADEAVRVTRALGCKDLKFPIPLLSSGLVTECVELDPGRSSAVALLSDAAASVPDADVALSIARHAPGRPRAAAIRIAMDASRRASGDAVGVVCAYFEPDGTAASSSGATAHAPPPQKRAKTAKPTRVRISHILLRWAGLKGEDEFARPGLEPPTRTQTDAERELLELLESLAIGEPKTLGARFKAEVTKRSECASALNVPYADLGWIEPGSSEPPLEAAAFNTPIGSLSDIVVSSRGAHLMYRMA